MKRQFAISLCLALILNIFVLVGVAGASDFSKVDLIETQRSNDDFVVDTLNKWTKNIQIIGVALIVIGILFSAIMFGLSMGNPQRRAIATAGLIAAAIGLIVVVKAGSIAGYLINT